MLIDLKKRNEQVIDTVSKDTVILTGFDEQTKDRAKTFVDTFKKFIEENKDELTALQVIYSKPYDKRHLTYEQIKELAEAIKKSPYQLTPDILWQAYERLEKSKVKKAGPQKLLTNIISLIRFAIGETNILEPFSDTVNTRFNNWLAEQEKAYKKFTQEQKEWLLNIKDHIASSMSIEKGDFELSPFYEKGGLIKAYQVFGNELDNILNKLNEVLAA
jgi:type I restriction enzyme R subunit